MSLSIVIPVKNPPNIKEFIKKNKLFFKKYKLIVIDSGGGEELKKYADKYLFRNISLTEARKLGYSKVKTKYTMNLDVDVIIPEGYIEHAIEILKEDADAISIFYEDVGHCNGALEFGCSIWKTNVVRELYDFSFKLVSNGKIYKVGPNIYSTLNNGWCECMYMWRKLKENGYTLTTCNFRAEHLNK